MCIRDSLKGSELGAAAADFVSGGEETAEEPAETEQVSESEPEEAESKAPEKEPEVTWRTTEDPWESQ